MYGQPMLKIPYLLLAATGAFVALWAPGVAAQDEPIDDEDPRQWRLGVMGSVTDDAYAGADMSTSVLPLIYFDSSRLFSIPRKGVFISTATTPSRWTPCCRWAARRWTRTI